MTRTLLTLFLSAMAITALAAGDYVPQRADFTFNTKLICVSDEDDPTESRADRIIVTITDGQGHSTTHEAWAQPLDTAMWQGFGNVLEDDINFDGFPDLLVCNGPTNSFGNFTYSAWLWDEATHSFVEAKGFDDVFDFTLYPAEQRVVSTWRLDDELTFCHYRWEGFALVKIDCEDTTYSSLTDD